MRNQNISFFVFFVRSKKSYPSVTPVSPSYLELWIYIFLSSFSCMYKSTGRAIVVTLVSASTLASAIHTGCFNSTFLCDVQSTVRLAVSVS